MAAPFHLDILAASVPFYRGDCVSLVLPTTDGEYGILANHSNAVGAITAGELRFETAEGEQRRAAVARAFSRWRMAACCCWWTRPSVPRTST